MELPVSVKTRRKALHDLAETPQVFGWVLMLVALGPPTIIGLFATITDAIRLGLVGESWGLAALEYPFVQDAYFGLVFALAVPFNLLLAFRYDVAIRIVYVPAWVFAAIAFVLFATFGGHGA